MDAGKPEAEGLHINLCKLDMAAKPNELSLVQIEDIQKSRAWCVMTICLGSSKSPLTTLKYLLLNTDVNLAQIN